MATKTKPDDEKIIINKYGYKWNKDTKYKWVDGMGEISGFHEGYEETCRFMVTKGLEYLDKQLGKEKPEFMTYKNIYGIVKAINDKAKGLEDYLWNEPEKYYGPSYGPTGAMIQASISHICWVLNHSWAEYIDEMSKKGEGVTIDYTEYIPKEPTLDGINFGE